MVDMPPAPEPGGTITVSLPASEAGSGGSIPPPQTYDFTGRPIVVGDVLAYPTRQYSSMNMNIMLVKEIRQREVNSRPLTSLHGPRLERQHDGGFVEGKVVAIQSFDRSVIIGSLRYDNES